MFLLLLSLPFAATSELSIINQDEEFAPVSKSVSNELKALCGGSAVLFIALFDQKCSHFQVNESWWKEGTVRLARDGEWPYAVALLSGSSNDSFLKRNV